MNKTLLLIIFALLSCFTSANAKESSRIDSLQNMLRTANKSDSLHHLMLLGEEYFKAENYSQSLDAFFLSLKLAEALDNDTSSADAANSIGRVYYNMENYRDGLVYFRKAQHLFHENGMEKEEGSSLNNIALIYYELDSTDQAANFYQEALTINEKYNDTINIGAISHNLGLVLMQRGRYDEAIKKLTDARKIFKELHFDRHAANATNNLGRAYYKKKDYKKALKIFEQGLEESKAIKSNFLTMDNFKYQADCYAKIQAYDKAYWYSNEYHHLKDSLLNINKDKQLAEIKEKYENEIETQENKLLRQENKAKAATIQMQYIIGVGIFLLMLLLAVLSVIYYRSNQTRKKANQLLNEQKQVIEAKNNSLSELNKEITQQHNEILEQKKKLEDLNDIKDKLFSIISHEFRSPLNSLKGTLALLKAGALSTDELNLISKELTDKINSTSIFLDNLLNWAKSQMQGINPKPITINLRDAAEENIQLLSSMAEKKKIRLINDLPNECQGLVDPNMMNLVFRNLISNAIKFTLRGGTIRATAIQNGQNCTITIQDDGIGMSQENINMLFKVQSISTRGTANERGTGLGLYITKNFIEANGGSIWVESEEMKGSTFTFTIPK